MSDSIYRENIIFHYRNPENRGKIPGATAHSREFNPLCGDDVEIWLKISGGEVTDAKFEGRGCAISQASASMLAEEIKHNSVKYAQSITKEKIFELLGVELSPARIKCALLSLEALRSALRTMN